ncbi:MAG: hypothetical protein PVG67_09840 [Desulfobacterales bacterium]
MKINDKGYSFGSTFFSNLSTTKRYQWLMSLSVMYVRWSISAILVTFLIFASADAASDGQVIPISINQLLETIDHPQVLILDVRTTGSWQAGDTKIKGAVRKNPEAFDSWANDLPKNKYLVLY